ncbi:MAG: bifunctional DNA-formamidopyrimidine glycosylase/DNA-(apurinic or apyrimidinic site) lyase, partial [Actinomycetes bacterium]
PSAKFTDATEAVGATVQGVSRRGKYLLVELRGPDPVDRQLVVHLGMTGKLAVAPTASLEASPHLRAVWHLGDGRSLTFVDVRRFGRIAVVPAGDHTGLPTLSQLGPEPWDPSFTGPSLRAFVNQRRRSVKTLLLSQRPVAGVGNIYADEALWLAEVHPCARRLTVAQADRLVAAVQSVLAAGVAHGGTTLRDYRDATGSIGGHQLHLRCYGRSGQPCERCGTSLRRIVVDARSTTYCPTCQRR